MNITEEEMLKFLRNKNRKKSDRPGNNYYPGLCSLASRNKEETVSVGKIFRP